MKTTKSETHRGYYLDTGREKELYYKKTLDQYVERHEYMLKNHSKILVVRLDIRTPSKSTFPLRKKMPRILETAKRRLESKNKGKNKIDMHHVWTAEQKTAEGKEHVHLSILVNANAIQNGYRLMSAFEDAVLRHIPGAKKGLVHFSESNGKTGILIDRKAPDFQQKSDDAIKVARYLAKTNTKEHKAKWARISSASHLPSAWR